MDQISTIKNALLVTMSSAIMFASCGSNKAAENKSAATAANSKLPVDVTVVSEHTVINQDVLVGSLIANKEVIIQSEVAQKIVRVAFSDGATVAKGQLLYKLDDRTLKSRLKGLQSELKLALLNEQRLAALLKSETVKLQEYDEASSKLQALFAQQEILITEISKTIITAPFSGLIGISKVQEGSYVSPGTPLVTIQDHSSVKINFSIPEKLLATVTKGKQIEFTSAINSSLQHAKIIATEPSVDVNSRTLLVQALASNPGGKLRPGISAKIYYSSSNMREKGISLPTEALIPAGGGYQVFLVKNGIAKITAVTVGNRTEKDVFIMDGLNSGDTVMVSNILRASDGIPVQVVNNH